jgi:hypothetical protein
MLFGNFIFERTMPKESKKAVLIKRCVKTVIKQFLHLSLAILLNNSHA